MVEKELGIEFVKAEWAGDPKGGPGTWKIIFKSFEELKTGWFKKEIKEKMHCIFVKDQTRSIDPEWEGCPTFKLNLDQIDYLITSVNHEEEQKTFNRRTNRRGSSSKSVYGVALLQEAMNIIEKGMLHNHCSEDLRKWWRDNKNDKA